METWTSDMDNVARNWLRCRRRSKATWRQAFLCLTCLRRAVNAVASTALSVRCASFPSWPLQTARALTEDCHALKADTWARRAWLRENCSTLLSL